ncbi:hypothetical protein [Microbacterium sp. cf046]|uniref:hypothetical protein n=1 Tax=Microbacterium sp. cf046 TaxID=1761803 RepID=UPI000B878341|nr:hypothetical protein [Microbacterium sp. cf046]
MEQPARPARKHSEAHELVAVILLSLVAVLTAWCGFQSTKWGGDSSVSFSEASSARIEASDFESQARDARMTDIAVYTQWVIAGADDDPTLADYIQERFSPELTVAFDAWQADGMQERGPFAMKEYVPPGTEEGAKATKRANDLQAQALEFNDKGDAYSLMTVLFALVLFLAAIAQRGISLLGSRIVLGLGGAIAVVGLIVLFTFPVRF